MNQNYKDADVDIAAEKLKRKYLERRKKLPSSEETTLGTGDEYKQLHNSDSEAVRQNVLSSRSKRPSKENMKGYNKALHELFKAIINPPDHLICDRSLPDSDEDLSGDCTAAPLQGSQVLVTETDVTLPSCLNGSLRSWETEAKRDTEKVCQLSSSFSSFSSFLAKVYQEMLTIYEQLKAERLSQQRWEKKLQERERELEQKEAARERLAGVEEVLHTHIMAVEEQKHQQDVSKLQDLLQEKSKENRRLKSNFDTIKELNDSLKKQLSEITEQNKKLEIQSKRLQARLDNLQRKLEHNMALKDRQNVCIKSTDCTKPSKQEKSAASGKTSNKRSSGPTTLKLLALLLDWILDGQTISAAGNEGKALDQCLPSEALLNERCLKVLPLLADQLHHTPLSKADLLLNLLRLIHQALRHVDKTMQHVALSATLRRIGEEVSKPPPAQLKVSESEDPDLPKSCAGSGGPFRNRPLYRSPCPHTRVLSILIILRTVTQADVLAQAVDVLHTELLCEESQGLFIHYGGVTVILWVLRAGRGAPHTLIDILMQLTEQSRYLTPFLEACSCEEFFQTASQLLKNSCLELPSLEKLSILLQKLSSIRKNRRLFEMSSLHVQIQELHHKTNPTHSFLCLNLRSILHNLK
ncbi:hypothetical protein LDENG_00090890 [Lucifuga dentata]|nr:hypothetical protein LDENG_00090890 [Lucifuga dentata]